MYIYVCVRVYIYIYIEREREINYSFMYTVDKIYGKSYFNGNLKCYILYTVDMRMYLDKLIVQ